MYVNLDLLLDLIVILNANKKIMALPSGQRHMKLESTSSAKKAEFHYAIGSSLASMESFGNIKNSRLNTSYMLKQFWLLECS